MSDPYSQALSLNDFQTLARRHLPSPLYTYVSGTCEDGLTHEANRAALRRVCLVPRILRDTTSRTAETSLLGCAWSAPIGIAPMGLSALMAYRGDIVLARAALAERIPMVISATALTRLEDVARIAPGSWFQAYLPADRAWIDGVVDRAADAGIGTLVLTADLPAAGNREYLARGRFSTPLKPSLRLALDGLTHPRWLFGTFVRTLMNQGMPHFENSMPGRGAPIIARNVEREFGARDGFSWKDVAHIRSRWKGHLVIKGVLHPEDARLAADAGADAVIVSCHGSRQLDGTIASLDALPGVVSAAGPLPVMIDSGFRRGSDVLKAIALGARMVFIGRPFLYAAAVGGEAGVRHAVTLLKAELDRNMAMLGIRTPASLGRDQIHIAGDDR
ncbi:L-lactate dehydrogenase (cytochrome) [Sphingobium sp. OAS761]|uniref:alpha-hydroxy acid oxidase n=1 Tax=Sphingobium sp. OAS761 TaxID=2817901 RepID=UPI0020A1F9E7|nr:alpha-hydroxy acid oxidase [Sphingobium sp. OAS761]MCP1471069.1 L-lactate dehydrogenase (cytochrome) [Sphingobium sp. OAS761]